MLADRESQGCWQTGTHSDDTHKTACRTPFGHHESCPLYHEWLVMPFGLETKCDFETEVFLPKPPSVTLGNQKSSSCATELWKMRCGRMGKRVKAAQDLKQTWYNR